MTVDIDKLRELEAGPDDDTFQAYSRFIAAIRDMLPELLNELERRRSRE